MNLRWLVGIALVAGVLIGCAEATVPTDAPKPPDAGGGDDDVDTPVGVPATDSAPDQPPPVVLIYQSNENGQIELMLHDLATDQARALTNDPLVESEMRLSPDGKWLAFFTIEQQVGGKVSLAVMNLDGSVRTNLVTDLLSIGTLSWTPDSQQIVYSTLNACLDQPDCTPGIDLFMVDFQYKVTPLVSGAGDDYAPLISPDGARLAFQREGLDSDELYIANADGADPVLVTGLPAGDIIHPAWSPDGSRLAFVVLIAGGNADQGDLYVVNADASGARPLITSAENDVNPVWMDDGRMLFISEAAAPTIGEGGVRLTSQQGVESTALWVIDAQSQGVRQVELSESLGRIQSIRFIGACAGIPTFLISYIDAENDENMVVGQWTEEIINLYGDWPDFSPAQMIGGCSTP